MYFKFKIYLKYLAKQEHILTIQIELLTSLNFKVSIKILVGYLKLSYF